MVDFEQGLHETFEEAFRGAYLRGCLFHQYQVVYCKVLEAGFLTNHKGTNSHIRLGVRKLLTLSFLPDHVEESFEELKEHLAAALQPIVDYLSRS